MPIKFISSFEFEHNLGKAKDASLHGPVMITDLGRPTHVLLCIEDFRRMSEPQVRIADLLAMPSAEVAEMESTPSRELPRAVDFS